MAAKRLKMVDNVVSRFHLYQQLGFFLAKLLAKILQLCPFSYEKRIMYFFHL